MKKSNKYFLSLEKWHRSKKSINCLQNKQSILIHNQKKILNELANYYENLYFDNEQCDENNCYDFVTELNLPTIIEEECKECDKPITSKECLTALSQLSNNKSPRVDGFLIEFYKTFWKFLDDFFLENIYFSINQKRLCISQYEGLITLLPKLNKNKLDPCNYRPITLLNCDYKILSKVINNRLYPLLTKLIRDDQNGFIKDRNIGDNIRLMFNVIYYANNEDLSGAVLSVDLYKAFDSLRWPFIFAMQRQYGFGKLLIKWIKVLYKNPKCRIDSFESWVALKKAV